jgi:hypothetical protein
MRRNLVSTAILTLALTAAGRAAPPVELELATERGVQITAPHEWLQLLTAIGIRDVRIRGKQAGDQLEATNIGTSTQPRYRVVGYLTSGDRLQLPGGTFTRHDRAGLTDYFERLAADGAESMTATRGRFGLTAKELAAATADLAQPIDFETKGLSPLTALYRVREGFTTAIEVDTAAANVLRAAKPIPDELRGLTAGTALAMMLRRDGMVLRPEKSRGQPVTIYVVAARADALRADTAGKVGDDQIENWPIGWQPQQTPGRTAPGLFEVRNAEIGGYTLAETLAALQPRIKVPYFFDHAALAAKRIEPDAIQVQLARTRTSYKRIIDRVLAQAHLHSQVRVDEAGTPFLWITR